MARPAIHPGEILADELSEQDLYAPAKVKAVDDPGTDRGTVTLEAVREGKPSVRIAKLAKAETFRGDAKAADIVALKELIQATVEEKFDIALQAEPVFVGF